MNKQDRSEGWQPGELRERRRAALRSGGTELRHGDGAALRGLGALLEHSSTHPQHRGPREQLGTAAPVRYSCWDAEQHPGMLPNPAAGAAAPQLRPLVCSEPCDAFHPACTQLLRCTSTLLH